MGADLMDPLFTCFEGMLSYNLCIYKVQMIYYSF